MFLIANNPSRGLKSAFFLDSSDNETLSGRPHVVTERLMYWNGEAIG